jgi:hypothetical protein
VSTEIHQVTGLVCDALAAMGVDFHIGGSLASSVHGYPRATLDADLVADLKPGHGRELAGRLGAAFYADAEAVEASIHERRSFNVIHLETMFKVDVFVLKTTPFDMESFRRSRPQPFGPGDLVVRVATPEDTVLHKLLWFQKGYEVSHRQWGDLTGVLKVQGERIDRDYLERWARDLGLEDLLRRAYADAFRPG